MEKNNKKRIRKRMCLAKNCKTMLISGQASAITLFPLPTNDQERCIAWLKLIGRPEYLNNLTPERSNSYVCHLHFNDSDLIKNANYKLKPDALPVLNLARDMPTTQVKSLNENVSLYVDPVDVTPAELQSATNFLETLGIQQYDSYALQEDPLNSSNKANKEDFSLLSKLRIFLQGQESSSMTSPLTNKSNQEVALRLLYANPNTYAFIQSSINLPTVPELAKACINVPSSSKIDESIFKLLYTKLQHMPVEAKYCTLCLTQFDLSRKVYYDITNDRVLGIHDVNLNKTTEVATKAIMASVRGIFSPWLQPIGYCFVGSHIDAIDQWLKNIIFSLQANAIEVEAITAPVSQMFYDYAVGEKKITSLNPQWNKSILFIFDAPQLMKSVCDNYRSSNLIVGQDVIRFKWLEEVYNAEKRKEETILPKLTRAHFDNNKPSNVKIAAHIFSRSVAAALHSYVDNETLPQEALPTARFIRTINDAFDVVNTNTKKFNRKQIENIAERSFFGFSKMKSEQKTNSFKNDTEKIGLMFSITLKSIMIMTETFKKLGMKDFNPRRTSLESHKNIIMKLKTKCKKLTCEKFVRYFRSICKSKLLTLNVSTLAKQKGDNLKHFVEKLEVMPSLNFCLSSSQKELSPLLLINDNDYHFDLPVEDERVYIAAFLLYKCKLRHYCDALNNLYSHLLFVHEVKIFHNLNQDKEFSALMRVPVRRFNAYVAELDHVFMEKWSSVVLGSLGQEMLSHLARIPLHCKPCECFPTDYLLVLFVRLRIYIAIKRANQLINSKNLGYLCLDNI